MKVSDVFASFLKEKKINTGFGVIGSANSHLYESFNKHNIKIINVHQEQCAVMAAGAYYKATGNLSFALVTAGAGASNAVTGILSLWADSTPTLIFCGQESSNYLIDNSLNRMYGTQGFSITQMVSKCTKYSKTLMDSTMVQEELETMYFIANDSRKGPTLLDVPFNIQSQEVNFREWNQYIPTTIGIFEEHYYKFKELLINSKKPVILAGNGIKLSKSTQLFKDVLLKLKIPVLLTWSGIDILENIHPLYFGRPGIYGQRAANFILQSCDLLITIGSRLTLPQTGYDFSEFARNAIIVMVDVDETEKKPFCDLFIHSDCNEFLKTIQDISYYKKDWNDECTNIYERFPTIEESHKDDGFPNSYKIIDKISDYLKNDQIIVTDMGTALLSGHQAIRLRSEQTMFSSYGLGEMGYGLPAALGASISSPNREVLCLNCDGGMMMNIQELQTIIQHKLKVKIVIFNNDGYLMIKHTQKMLFKDSYTAVDSNTGIVLPNYMKVADAFGYNKYQIKTWDEFYLYFPKFMDDMSPSICEIFMPPHQDFIPKVKGIKNDTSSFFSPPLEEMSPILDYNTIKEVMKNNLSKKSELILRN